MNDDCITREIHIAASATSVWRALTDPAEFGEWFRVSLDGPFVVGETTTGAMTYPGHEGVPWVSVTERMDPPSRFDFRWPASAPGEGMSPDTVWIQVSFSLQPKDGGTLVTVTESGFAALPEDQRISMLRDNAEGWTLQNQNLKRYVET